MTVVLWVLLGFLLGVAATVPVGRVLRRRAEERARDAERRARDAERLAELGSMTGGLAHEIKNPLSTIGLNADLLAEGIRDADLPAEERSRLLRRLDSLSREAERLRGILTDFLQFAGRVRLDQQPRDLGRIVSELCDFFDPQCEQAGVVLRSQLPPEPVQAQVDERLLKQALLNLMLNATQAMSDGAARRAGAGPGPGTGPGIAAAAAPGAAQPPVRSRGELILRLESDPAEARIHVIDTGPGIEPAKLQRIFLPYVSETVGGTGLGLSTARRIVEEHGGRLVAHSEPGKGSDFVVHLPRRAPA